MVLRWLGLISVAFSIAFVGRVLPSTRRTHDENMAKAEAFTRVFDREVNPGASFDEVLEYLKAHNLHFGSVGLTAPQDKPPPLDGTARLWVEMFREESPNCTRALARARRAHGALVALRFRESGRGPIAVGVRRCQEYHGISRSAMSAYPFGATAD